MTRKAGNAGDAGDRPCISSRLAGFYHKTLAQRQAVVAETGLLSPASSDWLAAGGGLATSTADRMSENVVAVTGLPFGLGLNFRVNQRDYLVPMAVEEPSVVAAASNAARLIRFAGGFTGHADPPVMTAQIQLDRVPCPDEAGARLAAFTDEILALGDQAIPGMAARGGGCRELDVRVLDRDEGMVVCELYVDVGDAMGANLVDTVAEAVAPRILGILGGELGLRILSNLPLRRLVTVTARVSDEAIGGAALADGIVRACRFAELDPLRAATHNKGIMNGIDAVAVALGQDWRSIEAGAHAYAALSGRYRPLAMWQRSEATVMTSSEPVTTSSERSAQASARTEPEGGPDTLPPGLTGTLTLPMAIGIVGGATGVHPGVRAGLEILSVTSATELAVVMAAVGLASNLGALRALAGEGIQRGHMKLHQRRLASEPAALSCTSELPVVTPGQAASETRKEASSE